MLPRGVFFQRIEPARGETLDAVEREEGGFARAHRDGQMKIDPKLNPHFYLLTTSSSSSSDGGDGGDDDDDA